MKTIIEVTVVADYNDADYLNHKFTVDENGLAKLKDFLGKYPEAFDNMGLEDVVVGMPEDDLDYLEDILPRSSYEIVHTIESIEIRAIQEISKQVINRRNLATVWEEEKKA